MNDFHSLIISTDVLHPNNNSESINAGTQYSFNLPGGNTFFVRGGVKGIGIAQAHENQISKTIKFPFSTISFGLGFEKVIGNRRSIGIDYSFQSIGILGEVSLITINTRLF